LVVIAIIAILAAILFPVFARVRENARRASCQSNMKHLALAWIQYTQDYDSRMPFYDNSRTITSFVEPYVKSEEIFACPSRKPAYKAYPPFSTYYGTQYGMPGDGRPKRAAIISGGGPPLIIDEIDHPSLLCMLAEVESYSSSANDSYGAGSDRFEAWDLNDASWGGKPILNVHFGGSNYAFMDGHVKWLKKETAEIPHDSNNAILFEEY
jgi:prepilin-type processing-associated H-X9-DG protein